MTIAGECADPALRDELTRLAAPLGDRVELRLERIPDEEVAPLFAACDAVVLPFREVTTSGSALLAMSHGRAVLLPDLPAFRELPGDAVVRYAGLGPALADLAARPADELRRIGAAASEYAGGLSWSDSASLTLEALGGCGAPDASDGLVRNASYLMANTLLGA